MAKCQDCECTEWVQNDDATKRNKCNNCGHSSQRHS